MTERDGCLHCARVYIAEARRRRHTPSFHATLLRWAANMRRRASANTEPRQHELSI